MLIHSLLTLLLSGSTPTLQDAAPPLEVRAFGAPLLGFAQAGDGAVLLTGGEAGLVLDGRWQVGVSLFATPELLGAGAAPVGSQRLAFWQGGLLLRREFADDWRVHPRVGVLLGAAWVRVEGPAGAAREGVGFAAEPRVGATIDVTRFLRVGVDVGYRVVTPGVAGLRLDQLSGVSVTVTAAFGWF